MNKYKKVSYKINEKEKCIHLYGTIIIIVSNKFFA